MENGACGKSRTHDLELWGSRSTTELRPPISIAPASRYAPIQLKEGRAHQGGTQEPHPLTMRSRRIRSCRTRQDWMWQIEGRMSWHRRQDSNPQLRKGRRRLSFAHLRVRSKRGTLPLSYGGVNLVGPAGIEPAWCGVKVRCLAARPRTHIVGWRARAAIGGACSFPIEPSRSCL